MQSSRSTRRLVFVLWTVVSLLLRSAVSDTLPSYLRNTLMSSSSSRHGVPLPSGASCSQAHPGRRLSIGTSWDIGDFDRIMFAQCDTLVWYQGIAVLHPYFPLVHPVWIFPSDSCFAPTTVYNSIAYTRPDDHRQVMPFQAGYLKASMLPVFDAFPKQHHTA